MNLGGSFIRLPAEKVGSVLEEDRRRLSAVSQELEASIRATSTQLAATSAMVGPPPGHGTTPTAAAAEAPPPQPPLPPPAAGTVGEDSDIYTNVGGGYGGGGQAAAAGQGQGGRAGPVGGTTASGTPLDFDGDALSGADGEEEELSAEEAAKRAEFVSFVHAWQTKQ
jgi:hypothetical protein